MRGQDRRNRKMKDLEEEKRGWEIKVKEIQKEKERKMEKEK